MDSKRRWALISVTAKDGIEDFARELVKLNFGIIASDGSGRTLRTAGVAVTDTAELSCIRAEKRFRDAGLEEKFSAAGTSVAEVAKLLSSGQMLGHRVVTLIPEVHAGLLAKHTPEHEAEMEQMGIPYIDLVCVDFYTLQAEIDNPSSTPASVLEKTDIGGPTMVCSGAKGRRIVICDPADRKKVIDWLKAGEPNKEEFITELAAKVEFTVATYRAISSFYWGKGKYAGMLGELVSNLKYGENAYQWAKMYRDVIAAADPLSVVNCRLEGGGIPGYVNMTDFNRLIASLVQTSANFEANFETVPYLAIGVKHGNPFGAAFSYESKDEALKNMIIGDLESIYGFIGGVNFEVDAAVADIMLHYMMKGDKKRMADGLIAPSFTAEAAELFKRKTGKCPLMALPALRELTLNPAIMYRQLRGGFLAQSNYSCVLDLEAADLDRSIGSLTDSQKKDLLLADGVARSANSNTVSVVKDCRLIGLGDCETSRKRACRSACYNAGECAELYTKYWLNITKGAVAASDSFFPFNDGPQILIDAGIAAIFATSGSKNDENFFALCRDSNVALVTGPDSKYRGFCWHG